MDDIAIHTKPRHEESNLQHHERHAMLTHQILQKLHDNDLYLKPFKCEFAKDEIKYLRVIIGKNRMHMDPSTLDNVQQWSTPWNPTEVRQFLGFTGYYHYFIPNYSKIARPLLDLIKKTEQWHWGAAQHNAFLELKTCMCSSPVLTQPDFEHHFYLQADASAYGVGAVLLQEGKTSPILANAQNQLHTPLPTTLPPSLPLSATMTSMSGNC
jgi:hypothetical protein